MLRSMWVRVTGCTVFAFPEHQTGSQLTDRAYQAGVFKGTGTGHVSAVAFTDDGSVNLGLFAARIEAIAAILRFHQIVRTSQSVGIE
jgi:hypothetical protein